MADPNLDLPGILDRHGKWLREETGGQMANLPGANLTGADLTGANLTGANLTRADLTGANLTGANLTRANLTGAVLTRANLSWADLSWANLVRANLTRADLTGAVLTGANLTGANLTRADLTRADLSWADLSWADLTDVYLFGVVGNMREVVSAQVEAWPITAVRMLDGSIVMQIGCERHQIDMWRKADPRWIAAMDPAAADWWAKWGAFALAIAESVAPAAPEDSAE